MSCVRQASLLHRSVLVFQCLAAALRNECKHAYMLEPLLEPLALALPSAEASSLAYCGLLSAMFLFYDTVAQGIVNMLDAHAWTGV